ncbi:calcium/sodium antiporter [uncultured Paraglaciecola sp.]|uniref:calcium/sodium antiporter n=1 Tax=uncultured Paraglaciecola sp. TaxID=1765024 RepID=UPI0030D8773C|tara:strand:+ start:178534 stop:179499 length:966 start_codon:yes stop_codon:yes gene_type:complete
MIWPTLAVVIGLPILIWSAERFIHGAAFTANYYGISPLFVGMFIIGFGTSAPEIIVSIFAALQGSGGLALGNAFGSNITNITLVVGVTALLSPIMVKSDIVRKELPILLGVTFFVVWQLLDLELSHDDAFALLGIFVLLISWSSWQALKLPKDQLGEEVANELTSSHSELKPHLIWLVVGLVILIVSSKILVWGAVEVAQYFNVSDVIIGLTIVGIGTSLPELMSSIIAVRKNEHELAIGNVVGSNLFNSLAVIGIAGIIQPVQLDATFLYRDALIMLAVTIALLIFCLGIKGPGKISRFEGLALVLCFLGYNLYLVSSQF